MKKEKTGVYIHIPFCKKKCKYCSFTSFECPKDGYTEALLKEIKHFYNGDALPTLYFGGGTPSLLDGGEFKEIIKSLKLAPDAEVTVEINPESASEELLNALYELGINRLSVGVQSFDDNILKEAGRLHTSQEAKSALEKARESGFKNINIDLIYGLPYQDLKAWENTLDEAIKSDVEHISLYGLKIEEGSYFYNNPPNNIADSDLQADMYLLAVEKLEGSGFNQYEISNFAQKRYKGGYESRHNTGYWSLVPYWGFGVGASGYINGKRYTNTVSLEDYLKNPTQNKKWEETGKLEEEIFLGLRRTSGIDIRYINKEYGIDFEKKYSDVLKKYPEHIIKTQNGYRLSLQGVLLSNVVLSDFI